MNRNKREPIGRLIPKPETKTVKGEVELFEEAVPIAQQIENLRTKIYLQERYNAVLKDNMEENTEGSFTLLRQTFNDIMNLQLQLKDAVGKEKWAVNNALRTHHLFQLALKRLAPDHAVSWMEDKIFDNAKLLNEHIYRLAQKRQKLEASEEAVALLEKWPIPGSLPWEVKMTAKMNRICVMQTNTKVKLECARILYSKYYNIRERLKDDRFLYAPIVRNLSSQLTFQLHELKQLQEMLANAEGFLRGAEESLAWTEKEASHSRRQRRASIAKMRKEMQSMVAREQQLQQWDEESGTNRPLIDEEGRHKHVNNRAPLYEYQSVILKDDTETQQNERLAAKRAEIDTFNDHAALLVDVMKIPNLTHIPKRLEHVLQLNECLQKERRMKERLKSTLIKQRDQLTQLLCVIRYTGSKQVDENNLVVQDYENTLQCLTKDAENARLALNEDANLIGDIQLAVSSLLVRIDGLEKKRIQIKNSEHLMRMLNMLYDKLRDLCQTLEDSRRNVRKSETSQKKMVLPPPVVPAKYLRVGDPSAEKEGSDEEDYEDFKVPGRKDIKAQSAKLVEQILLRQGIVKQEVMKRKKTLELGALESARRVTAKSAAEALGQEQSLDLHAADEEAQQRRVSSDAAPTTLAENSDQKVSPSDIPSLTEPQPTDSGSSIGSYD